MRLFLGIDPGASGGIARILENEEGTTVEAWPIPKTERDIWERLQAIAPFGGVHTFAVIERVHSSPQMGVVSSFSFGRNYGMLRMALVGLSIPFEEATPQRWQKHLGCLTGGDKRISKQRAQSLYPGIRVTNLTADALLLATYAKRMRDA